MGLQKKYILDCQSFGSTTETKNAGNAVVEKTYNKLNATAQTVLVRHMYHLRQDVVKILQRKKTPASASEAGAENRGKSVNSLS
jgi:hypothetical protein